MCADLPGLFDALASGAVSSGHVDAVARLAGRLDDTGRAELRDLESAIVGSATRTVVEVFEREMRDLERILTRQAGTNRLQDQKNRRSVKRWVDKVTGMCHTHLELDPEADARVAAVFDAAVATERAEPDDGRTFDQLQADVMVELITGARTTDTRVPECSVLIDLDTLVHGLHDTSVCETADGQHLPPDVIRRMGCEADIIPIVLNGDRVPCDVGRARRLATREQRHALQAMYATCGHPHCEIRFAACRIHHVDWWDHHGPTDLANLVPLCARHHHLVHEGGWTLTLKPDRTITLRRPDGSLAHEGTTTNRTPPRPNDVRGAPTTSAEPPAPPTPARPRRATHPSDRHHPDAPASLTDRTPDARPPRDGRPEPEARPAAPDGSRVQNGSPAVNRRTPASTGLSRVHSTQWLSVTGSPLTSAVTQSTNGTPLTVSV